LLLQDTRAIGALSWPILVAQIAVLANGVADTMMTGHYRPEHLAAVGIGSAIYATIFVTLMGVMQGLSPLVARHFGAGENDRIGVQVRQGIWLALALSVPGAALLLFPGPLLELARVPPEIATVTGGYLRIVGWGMPAVLLDRAYYAFTSAVGRPRPVMVINLAALAFKVPVSYVFLHGSFGAPELGAGGCALGTVLSYWLMLAVIARLIQSDPFYRRFSILPGPWRVQWAPLRRILALGLPIGLLHFVEVTSFTFMSLFLAPLGALVSGAHQICANLVALLFMIPMSLGMGTQVLIGQALGRRDPYRARQITMAGLRIAIALATFLVSLLLLFRSQLTHVYSNDEQIRSVVAALIPLLAIFHWFDALQALAVNALRGYHHTLVPTLVHVASLWGVGLAGGWWLTYRGLSLPAFGIGVPPQGIFGMWQCATLSLVMAAVALVFYLTKVSRVPASSIS
jgi:multidrug resistance protein, MATE family